MSDSFDFSWMVGRFINDVRFSQPQWMFSFEPNGFIVAECPWRLLRDGRVKISSEDHLQKYGLSDLINAEDLVKSLLSLRTVTHVKVISGTADLLLEFSEGMSLEIISFSIGYKSWNVTTPSGSRTIAQGGGQLCLPKN